MLYDPAGDEQIIGSTWRGHVFDVGKSIRFVLLRARKVFGKSESSSSTLSTWWTLFERDIGSIWMASKQRWQRSKNLTTSSITARYIWRLDSTWHFNKVRNWLYCFSINITIKNLPVSIAIATYQPESEAQSFPLHLSHCQHHYEHQLVYDFPPQDSGIPEK